MVQYAGWLPRDTWLRECMTPQLRSITAVRIWILLLYGNSILLTRLMDQETSYSIYTKPDHSMTKYSYYIQILIVIFINLNCFNVFNATNNAILDQFKPIWIILWQIQSTMVCLSNVLNVIQKTHSTWPNWYVHYIIILY